MDIESLSPGKLFFPNLEVAAPDRMIHCDYVRGEFELKYTEVQKNIQRYKGYLVTLELCGSMSLLLWVSFCFIFLFVCGVWEFWFLFVGANVPRNGWDRLVLKKFKFTFSTASSALTGKSTAANFYM